MSGKPKKKLVCKLDGNENLRICVKNRVTIKKFALVLAVTRRIYARGKLKKQCKRQHTYEW
jgi:hypothetical protein